MDKFDFRSFLRLFVDRNIEVFLSNQFFEGKLAEVKDGYFTLAVNDSYYYSASPIVAVVNDEVQFIRLLPM